MLQTHLAYVQQPQVPVRVVHEGKFGRIAVTVLIPARCLSCHPNHITVIPEDVR